MAKMTETEREYAASVSREAETIARNHANLDARLDIDDETLKTWFDQLHADPDPAFCKSGCRHLNYCPSVVREVGMLTEVELAFLISQNLTAEDVYDARGQKAKDWKNAAQDLDKPVILGSPCMKGNHRLRTRAGHCIQCDPKKIAYQKRHQLPGYVYVAGSPSSRILKIGTTGDMDQRVASLRGQAYGDIADWEILFRVWVANAGMVEGRAQALLRRFKISRTYRKDGREQVASELLQATAGMAINAIWVAIGRENHARPWRSAACSRYQPPNE